MAKRTKKRDTAGEGNEEMIAGVPLRRVQEFLCRHEHSDWFDFDWVDARAKRCATLQADPGGTPLHGGVSTTLQVASRAKPDQAGASILWDWEGMVRLFEGSTCTKSFPD
jgi:hypothetical protein